MLSPRRSVASSDGSALSCWACFNSFERTSRDGPFILNRRQNACCACSSGRTMNSQYTPRTPVSKDDERDEDDGHQNLRSGRAWLTACMCENMSIGS